MTCELVGPWPVAMVPQAWDRVAAHVAIANERSGGRYSPTATLRALLDGRMQLWTVEDGGEIVACIITELITYDTGLTVLSFVTVTGKRRKDWRHGWRAIAAWAKSQGAARAESWARKGWAREMARDGWRETHRLIEVDI